VAYRKTVNRWPLAAAGGACLLAAVAALVTPPPGPTAAIALAGWPRLVLYAIGGVLLGLSAPALCANTLRTLKASRRAYLLIGLGVVASIVVAGFNVVRLRREIADPLGPALWIASMLLLLAYSAFPRVGWLPRWPSTPGSNLTSRLLVAALLALTAATRLPALADLPAGLNADEGDRAASAFDVLSGQASASWFDSGWYYINGVYFRLLALTMHLFGPDLGGGRMLSALTGMGFVAVVAWFGCRNFGWRVGLVATAFAGGMGITLEHSRFLSEAAPTALLWAISIGAFLEGARTGRAWAWALAGIAGGLSLYFYPSARLWAVGAALTVVVLWLHQRDRRMLLGFGIATVATFVAAAPFLVHLSTHQEETSNRYLQTTVLDPNNQSRLEYLTPPEPLPELVALQVERTLGMFDRYPDGGGFMPTGHPLFGQPLAALTLAGAVYVLVRAWRDPRLAVLAVWFWLGLSGVVITVETPDVLRAVGMLPSLCFVLAVPLVDLVQRVTPLLRLENRVRLGGLATAAVTLALVTPEMTSYFNTFRTMPPGWGPATREGQAVAALGEIGPVYSLEMNEHMVTSGWVKLLAPHTQRGRVPNPGRELPALAPATLDETYSAQRPEVAPAAGQGLSFLFSPDVNQRPYLQLLGTLYPLWTLGDAGDGRRSFQVSATDLAATQGVTLLSSDGTSRGVDRFGDVPSDLRLPADVTWRAGVHMPATNLYRLNITAPARAEVRLDGVPLGEGPQYQVIAARGLHFLELGAAVSRLDQHVTLGLAAAGDEPRALSPTQTYRLMDAPWGLLGRVASRSQTSVPAADAFLDATIAMAFFDPEIGSVRMPDSIVWSGALLAPRTGEYRMAFAAEDTMHLQVDGQPVDVVTVKPEQWATVGLGSTVRLDEGPHVVRVTLDVTHYGRELARWNWVPPGASGALDSAREWSVVPPQVLRPDSPVAVVSR
jgi:hypothetical protein